MLAAIFGHVDIARLLLAAGADVHLQDNLGLTAKEWANRRGSSEVAQLFATSAEIVPSSKNEPVKQAGPNVEAARRNPAAEANTTHQQEALSGREEPLVTKADPERREARELRASAIETKLAPQQDTPNVAEEQQKAKPDPQRRRQPEEARALGTQSARIAAGIEHLRILEESRQRVEAEVRAKSQRTARASGRSGAQPDSPLERHVDQSDRDTKQLVPPAKLSTRPATLESETKESVNPPRIKRCPKCNTTYTSDLLEYCSYDATKLTSANDPLFNSPAANDRARPTLWALVAIMAVGGASIGYLINNYLAREKRSSAPIAAQMEQAGNARKDVPTLAGALSGMEVHLPEPEYPANAKTDGVSGTITVRVRVNKNGRVISARSSSGDWRLRAAAVKAAQKATFSAEKLAGREASGAITYVFRL